MSLEQREEWELRVRGTLDGGWAAASRPAGWVARNLRGRTLQRAGHTRGAHAARAMPDIVAGLTTHSPHPLSSLA
jgi:hypothetical protein